jgi:hypothetical protein
MSKSTRFRIGKATIETVKTGKKTWYRLWCRRKEVYVNGKSFDDLKEAKAYAYKISAAIVAGQTLDDSELHDLKRIYSDFKVKQELGGKIILPAGSLPGVKSEKKVEFGDFLDNENLFTDVLIKVNEKRIRSGLSPISNVQLLTKLEKIFLKEIEDSVKPQMSELIRELVRIKTSKTGGKGQRELEKVSKNEWRQQLGKIGEWIGAFSSGDNPENMKQIVIHSVNNAVTKTGKNKGKPWAPRTKFASARFASQLGKHIVRKKVWEVNHFEELPELFTNNRGYRPSATTFNPEEVEKIFSVASKKENLSIIPYLTFLFFSGVRPQEMADPNKKERRFGWKNMLDWKTQSVVAGGVRFWIIVMVDGVRMSKASKDRIADLSKNGLLWMEWWAKEVGKTNLPTTGKIPFSNRVLKRVKADSGLDWAPDIARHTFTSHAHYNNNFKCGEKYWLKACDHSKEIWERHYQAPKLQVDCDKYFNILPPNSSNEEKQTVDHVKLLKAS